MKAKPFIIAAALFLGLTAIGTFAVFNTVAEMLSTSFIIGGKTFQARDFPFIAAIAFGLLGLVLTLLTYLVVSFKQLMGYDVEPKKQAIDSLKLFLWAFVSIEIYLVGLGVAIDTKDGVGFNPLIIGLPLAAGIVMVNIPTAISLIVNTPWEDVFGKLGLSPETVKRLGEKRQVVMVVAIAAYAAICLLVTIPKIHVALVYYMKDGDSLLSWVLSGSMVMITFVLSFVGTFNIEMNDLLGKYNVNPQDNKGKAGPNPQSLPVPTAVPQQAAPTGEVRREKKVTGTPLGKDEIIPPAAMAA